MHASFTARHAQHSIGWSSCRSSQIVPRQYGILASASNTQNQSTSRQDSLEEFGRKASKKFTEFSERASAKVQREWQKLNAEHDFEGKAARAARRVEETVKEVDQTYHVRRKLRNAVEHVQKKWPVWRARLDEFATTWYGKATILFVLLVIMSSPLFWRALNLLLIVWWLAIPLAAMFLQSAQQKAAQRAQEEAEAQARARNPFADMFRNMREKQYGGGAAGGSGSKGYSADRRGQQEGPIIDAEYTVIKSQDGK